MYHSVSDNSFTLSNQLQNVHEFEHNNNPVDPTKDS